MNHITDYINLSTQGNTDILDITGEVGSKLRNTKLKDGIVNISVLGSTSAVTTCEYEPGLIKDLKRTFENLIPKNKGYSHDAAWNDGNAHSHLRASIVGPSLSVSFVNGQLYLGTWQQIIFHIDGTYSITVTAVNSSGESEHSTAIIITVEIPPVYNIPNPPKWITTSQTIMVNYITTSWNPSKVIGTQNGTQIEAIKIEKNSFMINVDPTKGEVVVSAK